MLHAASLGGPFTELVRLILSHGVPPSMRARVCVLWDFAESNSITAIQVAVRWTRHYPSNGYARSIGILLQAGASSEDRTLAIRLAAGNNAIPEL